jgi:hypothetical protein
MRCFAVLPIIVVLFACGSPQPQTATPPDTTSGTFTDSRKQHLLDSLQHRIDTLASEHFYVKAHDYVNTTYYHKNWNGSYFMQEDALTASVDLYGGFILNSCLSGSGENSEYNSITLTIGDRKYDLSTAPGTAMAHNEPGWRIFDSNAAWLIAQQIAWHTDGKITVDSKRGPVFVSTYELSERDKEGIRDCVELAETLRLYYGIASRDIIERDSILRSEEDERIRTDSVYRRLLKH